MADIDSNAGFWTYYLVRQYKEGRDLNEILDRGKLLRGITAEDICLVARQILVKENLAQFALLPADTLESD